MKVTYDSVTNLGCDFRNQQIVVVQNADVIENGTNVIDKKPNVIINSTESDTNVTNGVTNNVTNKGSIVTNDVTNATKRNNSGTINGTMER